MMNPTEFVPTIPTKTELAPSIYDGIYRNIKPFTGVKFKFQVSEALESKIEEDVIRGVANYFKNISLALANVAIELHLLKYVKDTVLREQLLKNERLRTILIKSLHKIESYLNEMGLEHDTKVELWQDKELNWNEIVINVKTDYKSHEEKMKIWKDLCRILDEVDKDNKILIEVNRL